MSVRRTVIGVAVLAVLVLGGLWWRATWVVDHLLHSDAPKAIAEKSGDVYRLEGGRARFHLPRRRSLVESVHLAPNGALHARRPPPRTALRLEFLQCSIARMHL